MLMLNNILIVIPINYYATHKSFAIVVPPVRYVRIRINIAIVSSIAPRAITRFIPQHVIISISIMSIIIINRFIRIVPPTCKMYNNGSNMVRVSFKIFCSKKIIK